MRSTVTVSVPQEVRKELDRVSDAEGVSRSDIVRESVRDYLFIRQFRALRKTFDREMKTGFKFIRIRRYVDADLELVLANTASHGTALPHRRKTRSFRGRG